MAKSNKQKPPAKKPDKPVSKPQVKEVAVPEVQGRKLLSFRVHPLLQQRRKGMILVLSSIGFLALVAYAGFEFVYIAVSALIIVGAFGSFVLPNSYVLTDQGIKYQNGFNNLERKWSAFGSYQVYQDGIQLLYKGKGLRERVLRGIFVYYGEHQEKVKEIIKERMAPEDKAE